MLDKDFDATRQIRERLTTAGIDFSRLTWRDTEMLVEDAITPLRAEIKRLKLTLEPCLQALDILEALLPYLPDRNDAKDYAASNEGRASTFQTIAIRARELIHRIQTTR